MSQINDLICVLRGLGKVLEAGVKNNCNNAKYLYNNSTLKNIPKDIVNNQSRIKIDNVDPKYILTELVERINVVVVGLQSYVMPVNVMQNNTVISSVNNVPKVEIDELNKKFDSLFDVSNFEKYMNQNVKRVDNNFEEDVIIKNNKLNDNINPILFSVSNDSDGKIQQDKPVIKATTLKAKPKIKQSLNVNSKARAVPASRIGRLFSFGSLAVGLGVGTATEYAKSSLNLIKNEDNKDLFLSPANAERIVNTLCKVRGAALKLGQLLSLQDEAFISPELQKIFERVRQSADFMPKRQVYKVMSDQLGDNWKEKFGSFEDVPFAAASIGQVHLATLHNGTEVAVKIQYPGVAKGIHSDIDNLFAVLNVWNLFPKGLFIENLIEVAKKELSWEVDYLREAECTRKFRNLLQPYSDYYVPYVADDLCAEQVLTTELIDGLPLDKCWDLDMEIKERIAHKIMKLCLLEMFVFRCMQTDPNWSNFFYNQTDESLILLDFGATREYSKEFMDKYIQIIRAAADSDPEKILSMSREMKFLTGYESKIMEEAHVETVMIMAEVFKSTEDNKFDFALQSTTKKLHKLIPTILANRLCPPPEEIYSLHRKLSGVFLLFSKLKVKMNCRDMFEDIYSKYEFGVPK